MIKLCRIPRDSVYYVEYIQDNFIIRYIILENSAEQQIHEASAIVAT